MLSRDLIEVDGRQYLLATSARVDDRTRVLKHGDSFGVFDLHGDIHQIGAGDQGLFHGGTRMLSRLELSINKVRPLMLNSSVKHDNTLLAVDLTNPLIDIGYGHPIAGATLHIFRARVLWEGQCFENLRLTNYVTTAISFFLTIEFGADFADIFEVRGKARGRRGLLLPPEIGDDAVVLGYRGLDEVVRRTRIVADTTAHSLTASQLDYHMVLQPHETREIRVRIELDPAPPGSERLSFKHVLKQSAHTLRRRQSGDCLIATSNAQFNAWIERSQSDTHMLTTYTEEGPYPYAGIPWFSTPFGRDGIITALEYLWVNPEIARGVLRFLAHHQAQALEPDQEAEPGKIFHELRKGEMPALGEVPFGRYYGSIDSTPLFVMLAGAYFERTGDLGTIQRLWPNIQAALGWIDRYGDVDGDGFVEYERQNPRGLLHQGWKDSDDSVFHADGRPAAGLIALCEVQGYCYAAKRAAATLAGQVGEPETARRLTEEAEDLRQRFNRVFWCESISTFAIALDGDKEPCRIRTSNAGQLLLTGIVAPEYVEPMVATLMSPSSFSGWGVRTLDTGEARYNPISYHNGSVWPHDNALIAAGLARCGRKAEALRIISGLFEASLFLDMYRLPELFSGLRRRPDEGPTAYPTACIPQAWAAASPFLLLQSCIGLSFDGAGHEIHFDRPVLPAQVDELRLRNLRLQDASVDLVLHRDADSVSLTVLRKSGEVRVVMTV